MNRIMRTMRGGLAALVVAGMLQGVGSLAWVSPADAAATTMRATTAVNVRSGPGTNHSRIGVLYRGQSVQAHSTNNGWTKVTFNGKTGYIASAYLTGSAPSSEPSTPAPSVGTGSEAVTTVRLNLRTGPSLKHRVSITVDKGTRVTVTGKVSGEFTSIIYNGQSLWAATRYLSTSSAASSTPDLPTTTRKLRATTALMIRTAPGSNYKSLGDVPKGTILDCTDVVTSGMAQCIWQGNVRWFNYRYMTDASAAPAPAVPQVPATTTQYATANLNIWHAATGNAYTGEIPKGSEVAVTGTVTSGRAQIVYKGSIRWVTARYLSATAPSTGDSDGGSLNKGWSKGLDQTLENTKKVIRYVWANFPQIKTMYGVRPDPYPDHPSGRAVDIMIPNYKSNKALGDTIANYFKENHSQWRIHYIIWNQRIWNVNRASEGWRLMANRGGDTANHIDHIHITVYPN